VPQHEVADIVAKHAKEALLYAKRIQQIEEELGSAREAVQRLEDDNRKLEKEREEAVREAAAANSHIAAQDTLVVPQLQVGEETVQEKVQQENADLRRRLMRQAEALQRAEERASLQDHKLGELTQEKEALEGTVAALEDLQQNSRQGDSEVALHRLSTARDELELMRATFARDLAVQADRAQKAEEKIAKVEEELTQKEQQNEALQQAFDSMKLLSQPLLARDHEEAAPSGIDSATTSTLRQEVEDLRTKVLRQAEQLQVADEKWAVQVQSMEALQVENKNLQAYQAAAVASITATEEAERSGPTQTRSGGRVQEEHDGYVAKLLRDLGLQAERAQIAEEEAGKLREELKAAYEMPAEESQGRKLRASARSWHDGTSQDAGLQDGSQALEKEKPGMGAEEAVSRMLRDAERLQVAEETISLQEQALLEMESQKMAMEGVMLDTAAASKYRPSLADVDSISPLENDEKLQRQGWVPKSELEALRTQCALDSSRTAARAQEEMARLLEELQAQRERSATLTQELAAQKEALVAPAVPEQVVEVTDAAVAATRVNAADLRRQLANQAARLQQAEEQMSVKEHELLELRSQSLLLKSGLASLGITEEELQQGLNHPLDRKSFPLKEDASDTKSSRPDGEWIPKHAYDELKTKNAVELVRQKAETQDTVARLEEEISQLRESNASLSYALQESQTQITSRPQPESLPKAELVGVKDGDLAQGILHSKLMHEAELRQRSEEQLSQTEVEVLQLRSKIQRLEGNLMALGVPEDSLLSEHVTSIVARAASTDAGSGTDSHQTLAEEHKRAIEEMRHRFRNDLSMHAQRLHDTEERLAAKEAEIKGLQSRCQVLAARSAELERLKASNPDPQALKKRAAHAEEMLLDQTREVAVQQARHASSQMTQAHRIHELTAEVEALRFHMLQMEKLRESRRDVAVGTYSLIRTSDAKVGPDYSPATPCQDARHDALRGAAWWGGESSSSVSPRIQRKGGDSSKSVLTKPLEPLVWIYDVYNKIAGQCVREVHIEVPGRHAEVPSAPSVTARVDARGNGAVVNLEKVSDVPAVARVVFPSSIYDTVGKWEWFYEPQDGVWQLDPRWQLSHGILHFSLVRITDGKPSHLSPAIGSRDVGSAQAAGNPQKACSEVLFDGLAVPREDLLALAGRGEGLSIRDIGDDSTAVSVSTAHGGSETQPSSPAHTQRSCPGASTPREVEDAAVLEDDGASSDAGRAYHAAAADHIVPSLRHLALPEWDAGAQASVHAQDFMAVSAALGESDSVGAASRFLPEAEFLVEGRGRVEAKQLTAGMMLNGPDGAVQVLAVRWRPPQVMETVTMPTARGVVQCTKEHFLLARRCGPGRLAASEDASWLPCEVQTLRSGVHELVLQSPKTLTREAAVLASTRWGTRRTWSIDLELPRGSSIFVLLMSQAAHAACLRQTPSRPLPRSVGSRHGLGQRQPPQRGF